MAKPYAANAATRGRPTARHVLPRLVTALGMVCLIGAVGDAASPSRAAFPGANGRIAYVSSISGNSEIYSVAANGSDERNHTNNPARDEDPAFSPDGSKLAFFSTRDGPAAIYTMNLNGTNVVRLTNDPAGDINPSFSPDGSKLAFTSFRDGPAEVYTMNADGTDQRRLTSTPAANAKPVYSPNGSKIAFMSFRDSSRNPPQPEIYVMSTDGSAQTRLTSTDGNAVPSFSPDGSKIVFSSVRDSMPGGAADYEIYIMNADGSAQTSLTSHASDIIDVDPAFSPDGSRIAFASTRGSRQPQIYTMQADGGNVQLLFASAGAKTATAWGALSSAPLDPPPSIVATSPTPAPSTPPPGIPPNKPPKVNTISSDAVRARGLRRCLAAVAGRAKALARHTPARPRAKLRRLLSRLLTGNRRCLSQFGRTPGPVTGLRTRTRGESQVELQFNAAGTDANHPPPARAYVVKQSLRPIRGAGGFARAKTLCHGSCRFPVTQVGGRVSLTVTNLHPHTTYYYAVAALDNVSARPGPRSQVVKAKTA